jgi:hypothetical protein
MTNEPRITCLQIAVEITPYSEDGKVMPRPRPPQIVVFESEIPDEVLEFVRGKLAKVEG